MQFVLMYQLFVDIVQNAVYKLAALLGAVFLGQIDVFHVVLGRQRLIDLGFVRQPQVPFALATIRGLFPVFLNFQEISTTLPSLIFPRF